MNVNHCSPRWRGFSLLELLVVIAVIGVLAAIILPLAQSTRTRVAKAHDVVQLRQYGLAVLSYATANRTVSAADLFDEDIMGEYVGREEGFAQVLSSPCWAGVNGLEEADNPRSFTLNSTLFRRDSAPNSPGHALTATEVYLIQAEQNRPLLFMGISQPGRNRAYNWGGMQHLNPLYDGMNRVSPGDVELDQYGEFSVLTLRVSGAVEFIDYARSNDSGWWQRDHLQ